MSTIGRSKILLGGALVLLVAGGVMGGITVAEKRRGRHWTVASAIGDGGVFAERGQLLVVLGDVGREAEIFSLEGREPVSLCRQRWGEPTPPYPEHIVSSWTDRVVVRSLGQITIRSLRSGKTLGAFPYSRSLFGGAISSAGDLLATGTRGDRTTVVLTALPSGTPVRELEVPVEIQPPPYSYVEVRFSPKEDLLLAFCTAQSHESHSYVWSLATGRLQCHLEHRAQGFTSRDELAVQDRDPWGASVGAFSSATALPARSLVPGPRGLLMVAPSGERALLSEGRAFELWSLETGSRVRRFELPEPPGKPGGTVFDVSAEGDRVELLGKRVDGRLGDPAMSARPLGDEAKLVRGTWRGWRMPSLVGAGCAGLCVIVAFAGLSAVKLPWTIEAAGGLLSSLRVQRLLVVFALVAGYVLCKAFFLRRAGVVSFSPEAVVFEGRGLFRRVVPWNRLDRYADGSPIAVDLFRKGEAWPRAALSVPTPDDAVRTTVLKELDAHGLVRVEGTHRWVTVARAVVAGALAVLLLMAAHYFATDRYRKVNALWHGTLSKPEASAALSELVTVQHFVRPVIGTEDSLYVEEHHRWTDEIPLGLDAPLVTEGYSFEGFVPKGYKGLDPLDGFRHWLESEATTDVEVDGRALPADAWSLNSLNDSYCAPAFFAESKVHGLGPGRHEIHFVTHLHCQFGACDKDERKTIEVVPGSVVSSTVKLVGDGPPDLQVKIDSNRWCHAFSSGLRRWLFARVEIAEGGERIGDARVLFNWDRAGREMLTRAGKSFELPPLSRGRHVLTFRFTPDARIAFENDPAVTEIIGGAFEREVVVDVP